MIVDGYKYCPAKEHVGLRFLPLENFSRYTYAKDGYLFICKECNNKRRRAEHAKNPEKFVQRHRNYLENHREREWAWHVSRHHKDRGISVELSIDELEEMAKRSPNCGLCGKKLCWNHHITKTDSPSIDRSDNELSMKKDNTMIICHQCNRTKGERSMKEFVEYCNLIAKKFGGDAT